MCCVNCACVFDPPSTRLHLILHQPQTVPTGWFAVLICLSAAASPVINPAALPILTRWKSLHRYRKLLAKAARHLSKLSADIRCGNKPMSHEERSCREDLSCETGNAVIIQQSCPRALEQETRPKADKTGSVY